MATFRESAAFSNVIALHPEAGSLGITYDFFADVSSGFFKDNGTNTPSAVGIFLGNSVILKYIEHLFKTQPLVTQKVGNL